MNPLFIHPYTQTIITDSFYYELIIYLPFPYHILIWCVEYSAII